MSPEQIAIANEARVKQLQQQIIHVEKQNETLFNCWQASEVKASRIAAKYLEVCRECDRQKLLIASLEAQIEELQQHLNPKS